MPSAVTGPPDGIAGCSRGFAPVMCAWCVVEVVYGWGPSAWCALWRLLRWLKLKQIPSVFCDSFRIPLSYLLSSTLPCVLLLRKSPLHQPALFRHRHRPSTALYLAYRARSTPSRHPTVRPRPCAGSNRNCCCCCCHRLYQRAATLEVAISACPDPSASPRRIGPTL